MTGHTKMLRDLTVGDCNLQTHPVPTSPRVDTSRRTLEPVHPSSPHAGSSVDPNAYDHRGTVVRHLDLQVGAPAHVD